ncbi:nucleotidyl transferase AbiEii/AbiGii toxin family protein [Bradyrhizobium zhanjiangense]|uniref:nucleotidyl transferase AbiEii/AbiGii toxin family protein n=1 Tax=Bradyrhizobium zhanjiangense TaxID=1325107 RepID=UPI001009924A|nr:nucleotidyl transferase AbiEii/AbiGii toxin family protein [Bradyrhizobium zhanjiangense]
MEFDPNSVKVNRIREETEYGGLRITADALVDTAKARIVIDIALGDAVESGLLEMDLSVLHDLPAQHPRASAREVVIAEKFQRWSCWAAPIFVVLAVYHWRGYLRALAHAAVIRPR